MKAFALPSFYDGQIRINPEGRERHGRVPAKLFEAAREALLDTLHATGCLATGAPAMRDVWGCLGDGGVSHWRPPHRPGHPMICRCLLR